MTATIPPIHSSDPPKSHLEQLLETVRRQNEVPRFGVDEILDALGKGKKKNI